MTAAHTHDLQRELTSLRKEVADLQARLERAHREVGAAQYEGQQQLNRLRTRALGRLRDVAASWRKDAEASDDSTEERVLRECANELTVVVKDIFFEGEKS